jgi:hypothetical protein
MNKAAEKEVQDTSCRGFRGVPYFFKFPPRMGDRGLIGIFSTLYKATQRRVKWPTS